MKIAYVTTFDSSHPDAWSGAGYQMPLALSEAGAKVIRVDNLRRHVSVPALARLALSRVADRPYHLEREPSVLRHYAQQVEQRLAGLDYDILLSPGSIPLTFVETSKPKVLWTDSTFAGIVDYYPAYCGLTQRNLRDGNVMESLALEGCDLAAYSSHWAAESAVSLYGLNRSKVAVVPFGANVSVDLSANEIASLTARRLKSKPVKLLFVGTNWERKRGDFAIAVTEGLHKRGVDALISVIGSSPERGAAYVKEYGFVSKSTAEGASTIKRCYREAHFLVHPAVAECNANVFSEACSFGLPIIANRTGGIPTSVVPGRNGALFEVDDSPDAWADWIVATLRDESAYTALCQGAHQQFVERLCWPVAAAAMLRLMEALLTKSRTRVSRMPASSPRVSSFGKVLG